MSPVKNRPQKAPVITTVLVNNNCLEINHLVVGLVAVTDATEVFSRGLGAPVSPRGRRSSDGFWREKTDNPRRSASVERPGFTLGGRKPANNTSPLPRIWPTSDLWGR